MSLNNIPAGNRGPGHPIQVPNYRQALAKKVPDTYPVTMCFEVRDDLSLDQLDSSPLSTQTHVLIATGYESEKEREIQARKSELKTILHTRAIPRKKKHF